MNNLPSKRDYKKLHTFGLWFLLHFTTSVEHTKCLAVWFFFLNSFDFLDIIQWGFSVVHNHIHYTGCKSWNEVFNATIVHVLLADCKMHGYASLSYTRYMIGTCLNDQLQAIAIFLSASSG